MRRWGETRRARRSRYDAECEEKVSPRVPAAEGNGKGRDPVTAGRFSADPLGIEEQGVKTFDRLNDVRRKPVKPIRRRRADRNHKKGSTKADRQSDGLLANMGEYI